MEKQEETEWQIVEQEGNELDIDTLKFVLEQGEKKFDDIICISENMTSRCYVIITVLIVIIPFLITRIYNESDPVLFIAECILIGWYVYITNITVKLIKPYESVGKGHDPECMLCTEMVEYDYGSDANRYRYFLLSKIKELQRDINICRSSNKERADKMNSILLNIMYSFIVTMGFLIARQLFTAFTS